MKKRFNIKEKWKAILCVMLFIAVLGAGVGIVFSNVKEGKHKGFHVEYDDNVIPSIGYDENETEEDYVT